MRSLRILLTNNSLRHRGGSELYVRDLALALRELGHRPAAYSNQPGEVGAELAAAGIPVFDDLGAIAWTPDIIHGQHHLETMSALVRFPDLPAVYFCHGWIPWQEIPPKFPRIMRYVAVDEVVREYAVNRHGIPVDKIKVIHNFVDLKRFKRRGPLPERPARALLLSHYVTAKRSLPVRQACARLGVALDIAGAAAGRVLQKPEEVLGAYDLVFAKSRAAMEAMAVGAAVVLCDSLGLGPMVSPQAFDALRQRNFGVKTFDSPLSVETVARQIKKYDPAGAAEVSDRIRSVASLEATAQTISELYEEVLSEYSTVRVDRRSEAVAAASYLQWLSSNVKTDSFLKNQRQEILAERARIQGKTDLTSAAAGPLLARIGRLIKRLFFSARPVEREKPGHQTPYGTRS